MRKYTETFLVTLLLISLNSCISPETLVSFDEGPKFPKDPQAIANFKPITIQSDDILHITVHSIDPIASQPFNLVDLSRLSGNINRDAMQLSGYLVDNEGYIDFPMLGRIQMNNKTLREAKEMIKSQLIAQDFLNNPVVNIRILNFRIKIMGEVVRPGVYSLANERVSIMEALTFAGDLTQYGRRDSILIVREHQGEQTFGYVNLNSTEIFQSPYFFLQQNDLVYIQPEKTKINTIRDPSQRILPWISAATSLTALIVAILR